MTRPVIMKQQKIFAYKQRNVVNPLSLGPSVYAKIPRLILKATQT